MGSRKSGSCVASSGAAKAIKIMTTVIVAPATALRWRKNWWFRQETAGRVIRAGLAAATVSAMGLGLRLPQAWVEISVDDVDQQVYEHVKPGNHQHDALDDRI